MGYGIFCDSFHSFSLCFPFASYALFPTHLSFSDSLPSFLFFCSLLLAVSCLSNDGYFQIPSLRKITLRLWNWVLARNVLSIWLCLHCYLHILCSCGVNVVFYLAGTTWSKTKSFFKGVAYYCLSTHPSCSFYVSCQKSVSVFPSSATFICSKSSVLENFFFLNEKILFLTTVLGQEINKYLGVLENLNWWLTPLPIDQIFLANRWANLCNMLNAEYCSQNS